MRIFFIFSMLLTYLSACGVKGPPEVPLPQDTSKLSSATPSPKTSTQNADAPTDKSKAKKKKKSKNKK